MTGEGTATYPGGEVYEGAFVAGKREGLGKLTYKKGEVSEGVWKNGILMGPAPAPGTGPEMQTPPASTGSTGSGG
jgi:hypothetical protein